MSWMARKLFYAAAAATAMLGSAAAAGTKEGVSMPNAITIAGERLVLNGMGVREATVMNVKVYVAGLYLESPSSQPGHILSSDETKRLALRFVRDVDRGDIVEAFEEGFKKNNDAETVRALKPRIDQLNAWMRGVEKGESVMFTYLPGRGVQVSVDGTVRGTIPGDDFAKAFFAIWLGPRPPNRELKEGLLGRS